MHSMLIYYIYALFTCANTHMMPWLTYDLESTFLRKGFKRTDTLIIEIALYTVKDNKSRSFQRLVNPLEKYDTGDDVIDSLKNTGQNPEKSINFWTKLLVEKKMIPSHIRRAELPAKASAISSLLKERPRTFVSDGEALAGALAFGEEYIWIAHNGKAFDEKIIAGNCKRWKLPIPDNITFKDSLPLFKQQLPDQPSYAQSILYKSLFRRKYMAHHALEDAKALYKMVSSVCTDDYAAIVPLQETEKQSAKRLKSDLLKIKGIGKGSLKHFFAEGVKSQKDLHNYIDSHTLADWEKTFSKVYAFKRLGERLFSGEVILTV